ncbi:hypothetical protein LCGC14_0248830 [marine sediment metagenome]|uniref:Uncharacterized protein n=1 Tax=marine sediment metagenome TaxID=412755 RepID=A0A0F9WQ72_9ZZZZ
MNVAPPFRFTPLSFDDPDQRSRFVAVPVVTPNGKEYTMVLPRHDAAEQIAEWEKQ